MSFFDLFGVLDDDDEEWFNFLVDDVLDLLTLSEPKKCSSLKLGDLAIVIKIKL